MVFALMGSIVVQVQTRKNNESIIVRKYPGIYGHNLHIKCYTWVANSNNFNILTFF